MQSANLQRHFSGGKTPAGRHGRIASGTSRSSTFFAPVNSRLPFSQDIAPKPSYGRFILAALGLFVLALIAAPLYSNSATMAEQSAVARADGGTVNIQRADSRGLEILDSGGQAQIHVSDMVSADDGTAVVQFFSDQLVSLYPSSRLTVERYELNDLGKRLEYMVWGGHVLHESRQSAGASDWIQISTPSSTASIRNAVVSVHVISPTQTFYRVKEGVAWISMGKDELFLAPNEELIATVDQPLVKQNELQVANGVGSSVIVEPNTVAQNISAATPKTIGDLMSTVQPEIGNGISADATWRLHIVQPGDSFWTIANKHSISVDVLTQANPEISDQSILTVGQRVRIPLNVN